MLDASEMPPTFGTDPALVCAHMAGGRDALPRAVEGAEDSGDSGEREMRGHVESADAVLGLSAGGSAAYVVRALQAARATGAWTLAISSSADSELSRAADSAITLDTGAEPLAGSTRLVAGTAQKILLNTLSTAVMVRLGKVYANLMVDVVATNAKLRKRALRLVMQLARAEEIRAAELLQQADGSVKVAVVMARHDIDRAAARALLATHGGSLRALLS